MTSSSTLFVVVVGRHTFGLEVDASALGMILTAVAENVLVVGAGVWLVVERLQYDALLVVDEDKKLFDVLEYILP